MGWSVIIARNDVDKRYGTLKFCGELPDSSDRSAKLTEEQLDHFSTSLKEVMGYIKYSKNKEQLLKFLHTDTHRSIEMNAVRVIKTITNTPIEVSEEEEEIEMCKAIEDLIAEERSTWQSRRRNTGRSEGHDRNLLPLKKLQEKLNIDRNLPRYEFFQRGYFEKVTGKIKYIPAAGGGVF